MNWKWIIVADVGTDYENLQHYVFINDSEAMNFLFINQAKFIVNIIKNENWKDCDVN